MDPGRLSNFIGITQQIYRENILTLFQNIY
jgi:hypothetical protein